MLLNSASRRYMRLFISQGNLRLYEAQSNVVNSLPKKPLKFLAKIASGWKKPDGLYVIQLEARFGPC